MWLFFVIFRAIPECMLGEIPGRYDKEAMSELLMSNAIKKREHNISWGDASALAFLDAGRSLLYKVESLYSREDFNFLTSTPNGLYDSLPPDLKQKHDLGLALVMIGSLAHALECVKSDGWDWDNNFYTETFNQYIAGTSILPISVDGLKSNQIEAFKESEKEEMEITRAMLCNKDDVSTIQIVNNNNLVPAIFDAHVHTLGNNRTSSLKDSFAFYEETVNRLTQSASSKTEITDEQVEFLGTIDALISRYPW